MDDENTYFPVSCLFSKQLNLLDFCFEKPALKKIKEIKNEIKPNKLLKFINIYLTAQKSKIPLKTRAKNRHYRLNNSNKKYIPEETI